LFDPASEFGNHINLPADFDEVDELAAPFGPLPPCPKSSPSNSMKKIPEEDESCSSSSANLSSIPKTEVEVFEFREVEASPAKPSKEACAQTNLSDGDQSPPGPAIQSEPTAPSPPPTNPAAVRATNPLLGCSPSHKPSAADSVVKDLEVDDEDEDELEFPSEKSSVCDCPAHVHDRESPLLMAQVRDAVRMSRTIKNSLSEACRYDF